MERTRANPSAAAHVEATAAGAAAARLARRVRDSEAQQAHGLAAPLVEGVTRFVAAHISEALRVEDLAAQLHLSRFHFARLFKQATGISPRQFVIRLRVEAARGLLERSELTVGAIAYRTGFASQSQFAKLFRRVTRKTPAEYRQTLPVAAPRSDVRDRGRPSTPHSYRGAAARKL